MQLTTKTLKMKLADVLVRPILTEKVNSQMEKTGRYTFQVDKKANKLEIKKAVEELYSVTVASVNTMRYGGKVKTRNTKSGLLVGRTNATKKAVVCEALLRGRGRHGMPCGRHRLLLFWRRL